MEKLIASSEKRELDAQNKDHPEKSSAQAQELITNHSLDTIDQNIEGKEIFKFISPNITNDPLIDEISNFIREKKISKTTMWRNPEFQNFYFNLKSKYADKLVSILDEKGITDKDTLRYFSKINPRLAKEYTEQITEEAQLLKEVFSNINNVSTEKQSDYIIKKLNLGNIFDNVKPFFIKDENTLIVLLDQEEYEYVKGNSSTGCFDSWQSNIPMIVIKVHKTAEDFSKEHYTELPYDSAYDELDLGKLFLDNNHSVMEDNIDSDAVNNITFKSWYAKYVLNLDCGDRVPYHTLYEEGLSFDSHILDIIKEEMDTVLIHEKIHSINRFLPVAHNKMINYSPKHNKLGEPVSDDEIIQNWLHSIADEIIAFSYERRMVPLDSYFKEYLEWYDFESETKRAELINKFQKKVGPLKEINRKIIQSDNYKKIACMFSLEDIRAWKFLDDFLNNGNMSELKYNKVQPKYKSDYYKLGLYDEYDEEYDNDWD